MWRKNRQPTKNGFCVGTDPNRNWDYEWDGEGSATFPCSEIYRGEYAFSAPEAKAIASYLKEKENVVLYIDWHAYSQLWLFPWGYDCSKKPKNFDAVKRGADAAAKAIKSTNGLDFTTEAACDLYPVSTYIYMYMW